MFILFNLILDFLFVKWLDFEHFLDYLIVDRHRMKAYNYSDYFWFNLA